MIRRHAPPHLHAHPHRASYATLHHRHHYREQHPVVQAAAKGNLEGLKLMHAEGANLDVNLLYRFYEWQKHPAQAAAEKGHLHVIKWLHEKGANLTGAIDPESGNSVLQTAIENEHKKIAEYLVDSKALYHFSRRNHANEDAISLCVNKGWAKLAVKIHRISESRRIRFDNTPKNALEHFNAAVSREDLAYMGNAIDNGFGVDTSDGCNQRPLTYAAQINKLKAAQFLLGRGANVNIDNLPTQDFNASMFFENPTVAAASRGHLEMLKLLIAHGAKINDARDGARNNTSLLEAIRNGHRHVADYIVSLPQIDLSYRNHQGVSAFDLCVDRGWSKLAVAIQRKQKADGALLEAACAVGDVAGSILMFL